MACRSYQSLSYAHRVCCAAFKGRAGQKVIWYARFTNHSFARDSFVDQVDGIEGDGADVYDEQLVDHVFTSVGISVAIVVYPLTPVHDRLD